MTRGWASGFSPVYNGESELLILGSFPSVKSRKINCYYGNPQNRFWHTVSAFFGEKAGETVEEKREFILRHRLALWDVVTACEIEGSSDCSISREEIANIPSLLAEAPVRAIFCNGSKSYELLARHFPQYLPITQKLPSTSPANPRFSYDAWAKALEEIFGGKIC